MPVNSKQVLVARCAPPTSKPQDMAVNSERLGQWHRVADKSTNQRLSETLKARESSQTLLPDTNGLRSSAGGVVLWVGSQHNSQRTYSMEQTQNVQDLECDIVFMHVDHLTLAERHVKDARSSRTHAL